MQKNVASQKWLVFAFDRTDNTPKTGDAAQITAKVRKDYGTATAVGDTNPTEIEDGYYEFDLTQAETNANVLDLLPESSTSDIQVIGVPGRVFTTPPNFFALGIEADGDLTKVNTLDGHTVQTGDSFARIGASGAGLTDLGGMSTTMKAQVNTDADSALADIHLDHLLAADYDPASKPGTATALLNELVENDSGVSRFTTNALEQGPSGGGGGDATEAKQDQLIAAVITNAAGTDIAADIIAIKAETATIVEDTGTTIPATLTTIDNFLDTEVAAILDDTNELQGDWANGGRLDLLLDSVISKVDVIDGIVDDILVDTDVIGVAGAGLTAIPWNSAWDADVQSECADALVALGLDHLVSASVDDADVADNSIIAHLVSSDSTAAWDTYDNQSDSLQAIRDRGDSAWTTGGGGGGSISQILNIQPMVPWSIDLANTATFRLGVMLVNSVDDLPSTAEIAPGTISIDRKAIGGTSWSSVVSDAACSESAGMIYYDEVFDSSTGYAEGDSIRITLKSQKITVSLNDYEISDATGRQFYTEIRQSPAPTVVQIADQVWDEAQGDHTSSGTFGEVATEIASILEDTAAIGVAGAGLTAVPWNAAWDTEVQSECNDALVALHLDHILAVDYDPASKPGVATALLNELVESDSGVSRFTANALETSPSGGGGGTTNVSVEGEITVNP